MDDLRAWHVALARYTTLRGNPPRTWNEKAVEEYHEIVSALEAASPGDDLSQFRIPDSEMEHKLLSGQRTGFSGRPGNKTYSKDRRCNEEYARRKMEGIAAYFGNRGFFSKEASNKG